jgi:hypothetical protein
MKHTRIRDGHREADVAYHDISYIVLTMFAYEWDVSEKRFILLLCQTKTLCMQCLNKSIVYWITPVAEAEPWPRACQLPGLLDAWKLLVSGL